MSNGLWKFSWITVRVSLFSNRQTLILPNTKLRGIYDTREAWVQELRNKFKVKAVKVHTDKNLAVMFTKCLAATVRRRLFDEIDAIAMQITKVNS